MGEHDDHDEIVTALHDVLLPAGVPVLRRVDIAAEFCVPPGAVEASGTWFDVVVLEDDRVALVLGEVPGSGMLTAAAMGGVRAVLRTALMQHDDLLHALEIIDLHARHTADARCTTVVVAVIDPVRGLLTYATAGHPAPVVAPTGAPAAQLSPTGSGALGTGSSLVVGTHPLGAGDVVVLPCTGLDRSVPGRHGQPPLAARVERLRERGLGHVESTGAALTEPVAARGGTDSVAAVVASVRADSRPDLALVLSVDGGAVPQAREELRRWLAEVGAQATDAMSIGHAVSELVANAVEHADHAPDRSTAHPVVRLTARHTAAGDVVVEVGDRGRWRRGPEQPSRGRGLALAAGLVDELTVVTDDTGTTARVRHRLTRPVPIHRGPRSELSAFGQTLAITHDAPGRVSLRGAFRHDDTDVVAAELMLASLGGTRALDVDLAGLTHLSSGGLRLLSDVVRRTPRSDPGAGPVLHAPTGSVADVELVRVGLPHTS